MATTPADEYRHACDTIDEQAVTIALLLEQKDELTAIVEAVKGVRGLMVQERRRLERSIWPDDPRVAHRLVALRDAVALLDEVEGL